VSLAEERVIIDGVFGAVLLVLDGVFFGVEEDLVGVLVGVDLVDVLLGVVCVESVGGGVALLKGHQTKTTHCRNTDTYAARDFSDFNAIANGGCVYD
jgi:hypothetical protein